MTKTPYIIRKAFSSSPSSGNPAAVVILPSPSNPDPAISGNDIKRLYPSDDALWTVAKKFNLPMTALLVPLGPPSSGKYALRWFYPAGEAELCGHATIALSGHLFSLDNPPKKLELQTVFHGVVESLSLPNPFKAEENVVALDFPELLGFKEVERGGERWKEIMGRMKSASSNWDEENVVRMDETPARLLVQIKEGVDFKGILIEPKKLSPANEKAVFQHHQNLIPFQIAPASDDPLAPQLFSRCFITDPIFSEEDIAVSPTPHPFALPRADDKTGSAHCAIIPQVLSNPECLAAIRRNHPSNNFGSSDALGYTVRVRQQSKEGGEMSVQWRKDEHKVRIFGSTAEVDKGEIDI